MQEWIHVITASKLPVPRGTDASPFYFYDDGFDPNVNTPFGPDKESMFLAVSRPALPTLNAVLQQAVQQSTVGPNGASYPGEFTDPTWTVGWGVVAQDLATSRELKSAMLYRDRDTRVEGGYEVNGGQLKFPLTEDFLVLLQSRYQALKLAVSKLSVPSNNKIIFSDLQDKEVSVGLTTLEDHVNLFALAYLGMNQKVVKARASIKAAASVEEVNAVTWTF